MTLNVFIIRILLYDLLRFIYYTFIPYGNWIEKWIQIETFQDDLNKVSTILASGNQISDVNKDWTCKDKDKDLNLVLKESLRTRTRTRINITKSNVFTVS